MNFIEAAHEIANWAYAHPGGSCAIATGFAAAVKLTYDFAKPYFARPTPTGFDDPAVQASRKRSARLIQREP